MATLKDFEKWLQKDLVRAIVHGGMGIQGIAQTDFYKFISSPQGLSELGIEKTEPPKLLKAYESTIKIERSNDSIKIKFGDSAILKLMTPHPAAGTGNLHVTSWLEWVLDGVTVDRGFVPRSKIPERAQDKIRIQSAPGGLMLPRGSFGAAGLWRFPAQFVDYEEKWFRDNATKLEQIMETQIQVLLNKNLL